MGFKLQFDVQRKKCIVKFTFFGGIVDAEHSFDRPEVPLTFIPDGVESTRAPVYYLDEHANFYDLYSGKSNPLLTGSELRTEIHDRFGHEGCTLGAKPGQPELFTEDMLSFFRRTLIV